MGVAHRRVARIAAEQCPRIKTDTLDPTIHQQAVEQALGIAFGNELRVTHFDGQGSLKCVYKAHQLGQTRRPETGWQLQPKRRYPPSQGPHELQEVFGGLQLLTQIAAVVSSGINGKKLEHALNAGTEMAFIAEHYGHWVAGG